MIKTPDWVKHAVFYQVFPDRFARSPRRQHPPGLRFKPWGSPPEQQGFQGGDLLGIVDKLDYLKDLGITALYLNPIFASASNHRYHPFDYMEVDPLLGGNAGLRELLDAAHQRDMRVVLDGVFNHASRGFWPFHHILETGGNSPYLDWFYVRGWPLRPYHSNAQNPPNYDCWWNLPALPKINIQNPGAREYILKVARHWIEFGIDGWRLDVPEEINDEAFWQEFRRVVKEANPEAYIVGEIWHLAHDWLQGDRFDAVMNYPVGLAAINFFGAKTLRRYRKHEDYFLRKLKTVEFAAEIEKIYSAYDWEINFAQLNLFDSHDTARALWMVRGDTSALKLAVLFLMTMPGAPCIYYGDEIGMSGKDDPYCRAAFPTDTSEWNMDLLQFYKAAIRLRHENPCLRTGVFQPLYAGKGIYAFGRALENRRIIAIFNRKGKPVTLDITVGEFARNRQKFKAIWGGESAYTVGNGELKALTIPARSALILLH
jgi:neopullulanase